MNGATPDAFSKFATRVQALVPPQGPFRSFELACVGLIGGGTACISLFGRATFSMAAPDRVARFVRTEHVLALQGNVDIHFLGTLLENLRRGVVAEPSLEDQIVLQAPTSRFSYSWWGPAVRTARGGSAEEWPRVLSLTGSGSNTLLTTSPIDRSELDEELRSASPVSFGGLDGLLGKLKLPSTASSMNSGFELVAPLPARFIDIRRSAEMSQLEISIQYLGAPQLAVYWLPQHDYERGLGQIPMAEMNTDRQLSVLAPPGTETANLSLSFAGIESADERTFDLRILMPALEVETTRTGGHRMPTRKSQAPHIQPSLSPDRALLAMKKQLRGLQDLGGHDYREAHAREEEWEHLTQSIIERTFGNPSSNMNKFYDARAAGTHFVVPYGGGMPHDQKQANFAARIQAYEALLRSCVAELEFLLPETDVKGVYARGEEYEFYRDVKAILARTVGDALIVDPYLSAEIFGIYADGIPRSAAFRLLTTNPPSDVVAIAKKYAAGGNLQFRETTQIHDRAIAVDGRIWVVGQSLKDAAKTKPTYIVEIDARLWQSIYSGIWAVAQAVI